MCEPTMLIGSIMAITAAASSAFGIMQQNDYADKQKSLAEDAYEIDMDALDDKKAQIEAKGQLDVLERQRQAKKEAAKARVSAAEGGVFGNSQIMEQANVLFQQGYDTAIINKNVKNQKKQVKLERRRSKAGLQTRKAEADSMKTSGWAAGLQIAGSAISGGATGYDIGSSFSNPKP